LVADGDPFTVLFSFYINYKYKSIVKFTYLFFSITFVAHFIFLNKSFKNDYYIHFACHAYKFYTNKYLILSSDNSLNGIELVMAK
jgi:hypothetical protein